MAIDDRPPAAATEWRGIWSGVSVGFLVGAVLWLTDILGVVPASVVASIVGIAAALFIQRYLHRIDERR